jgi:hypothetical protein
VDGAAATVNLSDIDAGKPDDWPIPATIRQSRWTYRRKERRKSRRRAVSQPACAAFLENEQE